MRAGAAGRRDRSCAVVSPPVVGTTHRVEARVVAIPVRGSGEVTELRADRHSHDETSIAMEDSFDRWLEPHGDGVRVATEHQTDRFWNLPVVGLSADGSARAERRTLERLTNTLEAAAPRSRGGTS
jgi:hypothetical protein